MSASDNAKQRRKEQSRVRQLRYRLRKLQYEHDLEASIKRIRDEIDGLERQRDRAASSASPSNQRAIGMNARALATAHRFVDCFAFGFAPSSGAPWLPRAHTSGARPNSEALPTRGQAQIAFVEEAVDAEVQWGARRGQNAFLEHWRRYTSVCDGFHMDGTTASFRVSAFENDGSAGGDDAACIVCHVRALVSLEISATTLCAVLPTLQRRRPELALRLRGQRVGGVRLPATFALLLNASGRVSSFDARLDWIHVLRPLVGSLADVAAALDGANVLLAGQIGHERDQRLPVFETGTRTSTAPERPSIACVASSSTSASSSSSSSASTSTSPVAQRSPPRMRLAYLLTSEDDAPCVTSV